MTFQNAIKRLISAPDESAEGVAGSRLRAILHRLGNPQKEISYLRLVGISGKTVCSHMLSSVLCLSDYTTGTLTMSLDGDVREAIRIDHAPISFEELAEHVGLLHLLLKQMNKERKEKNEEGEITATKHELLLCTALLAFRAHGCRLCIIEGNGASSDPTRFLPTPVAAAVCGEIPCDQPNRVRDQIRSYLYHGIQEIVCAPQKQEAYHLISEICAKINCRLTFPARTELTVLGSNLRGSEFSYRSRPYRLRLCGTFQVFNAIVTLEILAMLCRRGFQITETQIAAGLEQARLPARFELLSVSPTIIVDSSYTADSVRTVCGAIGELRDRIGSSICVCVPDEAVAKMALHSLEEQGCAVRQVVLYANSSERASHPCLHSPREVSKHITQSTSFDSVWLILGHHTLTVPIREALLKQLDR